MITSVLILNLGILGGCGGSCHTVNCPPPSTKTYEVCGAEGSSLTTSRFGGKSCDCDTRDPASPACRDCYMAVFEYCGK